MIFAPPHYPSRVKWFSKLLLCEAPNPRMNRPIKQLLDAFVWLHTRTYLLTHLSFFFVCARLSVMTNICIWNEAIDIALLYLTAETYCKKQGRIHGYPSPMRVGRGHNWGQWSICAGAVRPKTTLRRRRRVRWTDGPTNGRTDGPTGGVLSCD